MAIRMGTPAQGRWGQLWGHGEQCHERLLAACCVPWSQRPPGQGPSPAERAAQAAVAGAAPQAAGAEVVVAVEQAGVLVGLVAEQAHQRVAVGLLQLRAAPQWGEDAASHLWGREWPPRAPLHPCARGAPTAPLRVSTTAAAERTNPVPWGLRAAAYF